MRGVAMESGGRGFPRKVVAGAAVLGLIMSGVSAAVRAQPPDDELDQPTIIGGDEATPGAWPFMAFLETTVSGGYGHCGGSLIDADWIATAAHCVWDGGVVDADDVAVVLGVHDLTDLSGAMIHDVDAVLVHPQYVHENSSGMFLGFNDLALLHLATRSPLAPVGIADPADAWRWAAGVEATIIGWGLTSKGGSSSETLLQAVTPIVTDAVAEAESPSQFDPETKIGAGGAGTNICEGDSGGPLLAPDGAGGWIMAGISSASSCYTDEPAFYTEVAAFNRWITGSIVDDAATTKVMDPWGAATDRFGYAIDLDDDTLVVGAPKDDHPDHPTGPDPGSFSVFATSGGSWQHAGKWTCNPGDLTAADSGFFCGHDVAIDADTAVFGAPQWSEYYSGVGWIELGAAFVMEESGGAWAWDSDAELWSYERNNWYGREVAVDGDRIVIGAPHQGVGDDVSSGAAFVFERSSGWSDETELEPPFPPGEDPPDDYIFGSRVAISGDTIVVTADDGIHVYRPGGGGWTHVQQISYSYGTSLEIEMDGTRLVVGDAVLDDVDVYLWDGGSFVFEQELPDPEDDAGSMYADDVDIDGDRVVVGAPGRDTVNGDASGAAYVFDRSSGSWTYDVTLLAPDGMPNDLFGDAVAISGTNVAIGAWHDDNTNGSDAGAVYVFDLDWTGTADSVGPIVSSVDASPDPVDAGATATVTAQVDERDTGDAIAAGATYSLDGGPNVGMSASDGTFNATIEDVTASLDAPSAAGEHRVCVTGRDAFGNLSDPRCATFRVGGAADDDEGPVAYGVTVTPNPVVVGSGATITATIDDTGTGGSNIRYVSYAVTEYPGTSMDPVDGSLDSPLEHVRAIVPVFNDLGTHFVCLSGSDIHYNIGDSVCLGFEVVPPAGPPLEPIVPGRVLETRSIPGATTVDGLFEGIGRRPAGSTLELTIAGRAGVPANAEAVMLNVTAVNPSAPGFLTVYPCGTGLPTASNVNYLTGQVAPNAVLAKIGTNGKVCIYTLANTHLITDVAGYVPVGGSPSSIVPGRVLETRSIPGATTVDGLFEGIGRRPAGSTLELTIAGRAGVPANAEAVMLNVTAVNPSAPGFLTVYPCGTGLPTASNVNYLTGQVAPNAVLAKIGTNGKVCIYTLANTHLITDVAGYVPVGGSPSSIVPGRVLETRSIPGATTVDGLFEGIGRRPAGSTLELTIAGRAGVPANAEAVMLNVTAVNPSAPGFLTVYPCGTGLPTASNVNYLTGQVAPNAVLAKIGTNGKVCIYTLANTHLITDVAGYV